MLVHQRFLRMVPDFVEVYDNALDASICRSLIDRFEASRQARRSETGSINAERSRREQVRS
jgi:hypothetical protein